MVSVSVSELCELASTVTSAARHSQPIYRFCQYDFNCAAFLYTQSGHVVAVILISQVLQPGLVAMTLFGERLVNCQIMISRTISVARNLARMEVTMQKKVFPCHLTMIRTTWYPHMFQFCSMRNQKKLLG